MRRRAFTLIELLVTIAIVGILSAAIARAFGAGVDYVERTEARRVEQEGRARFEDQLSALLRRAGLSTDATDTSSYFIASVSGGGGGGTLGGNADTIVFNVRGAPLSGAYLASSDDFETRNERFGPQGGTAEIQLSLTPVGEAGDREGLFIREQRPADGDPTQGGLESVFNDEIRSIGFEFWDGQEWQTTWDTQTQQEPRLPAAIRVSYTFEGDDSNQPRVLIVRLPTSDVTADDPVVEGAGTGGAAQ
jgi:prepilin-type N-terminal cleavage/methylation domain-containing protein